MYKRDSTVLGSDILPVSHSKFSDNSNCSEIIRVLTIITQTTNDCTWSLASIPPMAMCGYKTGPTVARGRGQGAGYLLGRFCFWFRVFLVCRDRMVRCRTTSKTVITPHVSYRHI